jgi:hypothetical protein
MGAERPGPAWTICFAGTFGWDRGLRRDAHRVLGALAARGHRPVYVEPAIPLGRSAPPSPRPAGDDPGVTVLTPRTAGGQSSAAGAALNTALQRRTLRRAWDRAGLPEPDLVIVHPPHRRFAWEVFPGALRVWRAYDHLDAEDARAMAGGAELVLTSSPRFLRLGILPPDRTRLLPNACDELSDLAVARPAPGPGEEPVVGTMGTFTHTTDLVLLRGVVERSPGVRFLFQGVLAPETAAGLRHDRVRLVERSDSDPAAVRSFLRAVRAGLLPYARTEWLLFAAPSRLPAFLRAGLPVVTTDFSEDALAPLRDLRGVFVAGDEESFRAAIPRAVEAGQDASVVRELVEAAEPHLAANVAVRFEELVGEALSRRGR